MLRTLSRCLERGRIFSSGSQIQVRNWSLAGVIVEKAPPRCVPYLRTMRVDRPIGTWLLFWPCGWSLALAAPAGSFPDPKLLGLFASGAFLMRSAGCTINDMWDKDIDSKVTRTRDRPLAAGDISRTDALALLSLQLSGSLWILLQMNFPSVLLGASSLGLVILYPLAKRITFWPQLFLGFTFNWGALLGWVAAKGTLDLGVTLPLYFAGAAWTLVYDTIYAHQDKSGDLVLGIKSTAIKFGENTKLWLAGFSGLMISNLLIAGSQADQSWPFFGAVGLVGIHLAKQVHTLDINNPKDCGNKFVLNQRIGFLIFLGCALGTYL